MPSKARVNSRKKPNDTAEAVKKDKPQWPTLRPLVPTSDLTLDIVLEDQIILIPKLFTVSLSQQYVSFLSRLHLTTTPGIPKKGEALRVNDRFQIEDPQFAEQLWSSTALRELVTGAVNIDWGGIPIGLNPRIRIYRYSKGQFFDKHYDESNMVTCHTDAPTPAKTTWTLLLYLTGPSTGCVGGDTVFYPEFGQVRDFSKNQKQGPSPIRISPEVGLALLHRHGDDCLLHEGSEVTAGEKWIIRSDVCVRR